MKKIAVIALGVMIASAGFTSTALAATAYGDSVHNFAQGLKKGGAAVDVARSNPANALGAPDAQFVSLGFGGSLEVKFAQLLGGTLSVTVSETTNGAYPDETADVYVSEDGSNWTLVGTATNDGGNQADSVIQLNSEMCVEYVRIVDTTNSGPHNNDADGFDVDAVAAEYTGECDEKEAAKKIKVTNNNGADVVNEVFVKSSTGGNDANGGDAGSAGNGGSVNNSEDGNTGGNGGNAGNGGMGGAIFTGDAVSSVSIANVVNYNVTRINACGCDTTFFKVKNNNGASVGNGVVAFAKTGYNDADGGNTGSAGDGGSVNNSDDDNTGGNGGNSGTNNQELPGGSGGWIETGAAASVVNILNQINHNFTRIR